MKLTMNVQLRCPRCGSVMQNDHDNTTRCTFAMCDDKGIRYDLPTIEVNRSANQRTEPVMSMD